MNNPKTRTKPKSSAKSGRPKANRKRPTSWDDFYALQKTVPLRELEEFMRERGDGLPQVRRLFEDFKDELRVPNATTAKAMNAADKGRGRKFKSSGALFKDLGI